MEVVEFGKENSRRIVLIPGNLMSWRQFENVIPLLEKDFHVIAVSTDGYQNGTHFAFPESMLKRMLPVGSALLESFMFRAGKEHPKECRETRLDIDRRLQKTLREWVVEKQYRRQAYETGIQKLDAEGHGTGDRGRRGRMLRTGSSLRLHRSDQK